MKVVEGNFHFLIYAYIYTSLAFGFFTVNRDFFFSFLEFRFPLKLNTSGKKKITRATSYYTFLNRIHCSPDRAKKFRTCEKNREYKVAN